MDRDEQTQDQEHVRDVQARYQNDLMRIPNVQGIGIGYKSVAGQQTKDLALIVMVDRKVPLEQLAPEDRIPERLDGVLVDVQATGGFQAG